MSLPPFEDVPGEHCSQKLIWLRYPAWQTSHAIAPNGATVPLAQGEHSTLPFESAKRPISQAVHLVDDPFPLYLPELHAAHAEAPVMYEKLPAGHAEQLELALAPAKLPGPQGLHKMDPGDDTSPGGHFGQKDSPCFFES